MLNYILRRLFVSLMVIFAISITSFFIIQLPPGDFASNLQAFLLQTGNMTEDQAEEMTQLVRATIRTRSAGLAAIPNLDQGHRD